MCIKVVLTLYKNEYFNAFDLFRKREKQGTDISNNTVCTDDKGDVDLIGWHI